MLTFEYVIYLLQHEGALLEVSVYNSAASANEITPGFFNVL